MAVFKCKMCGGTIEFVQGATVGVCDSCGTKQTLPRLDDDRRANLYDRANHFRRNNEFDKAASIYEQMLNEDTADAEAYWSLVLCHYGIEYVEDPATHKRVPTVNRAQFTSIFDDDNYKSAIQYADGYQREIYEKEAKSINDIQKGILAISQKEEPFDIFICYKETDNNGRRTQDSVLANDLYHQLTQEGFKVFFSRITLEDKLGTAYEPYIFAALNSAKVMVVLGTKPEYFNAVWVKNEWSRYLALVKQCGGKKVLIPAYRDMDPYDLPEEFSHLQAQDMSKLGFMQDLIRGIKKLAESGEKKQISKETVVIGGNATVTPLLKRVFLFLEDGEWNKADEFCEQVLNIDPENAQAYLGKLLADLRLHRQEELAKCKKSFEDNKNYQKAVRYGGEQMSSAFNEYLKRINENIEYERRLEIYNSAMNAMNIANTEGLFRTAWSKFKTIPGFKDADELAEKCMEKAELSRKNNIYLKAKANMNTYDIPSLEEAIKQFESIIDYEHSDIYTEACKEKIAGIKEARLKEEAEEKRKSKIIKGAILIIIGITSLSVAIVLLVYHVFIPMIKYNKALSMLDKGDYDLGYKILTEIDRDDIINSNKYERALGMIESGEYSSAYEMLEEIGNSETVLSNKYNRAIEYIESGDYDAVYILLDGLNYKDSEEILYKYKSEAYRIILRKANVGSYCFFGSYEQDNNTSNGKEDIEWLVLVKEENRLLLISKYAIDCKQYSSYTDANTSWEKSSLRKWLNETFINLAFNSTEQSFIVDTLVTADMNPSYLISPGNDTKDKVFLLSITEATNYFSTEKERECIVTDYAISQGATSSELYAVNGKAACMWWLRSPGYTKLSGTFVYPNGAIDFEGCSVRDNRVSIRPAMWINLD